MNTYKEVATELKKQDLISDLYRFQGGKSFEYFDIKKNRFSKNGEGNYIYFSSSLKHHQYFTLRRLRQLINQLILLDTPYIISNKQLGDSKTFAQIKSLINNSDKLNNVNSIHLMPDSSFMTLIKDNCFCAHEKNSPNSIERVDRRVFSGGYGISAEWLQLLEIMTIFTTYQKIDSEKILELIRNMKKSGRINSIHNMTFLFEDKNYKINPTVFEDFTKYEIMNLLECILDQNLYNPNSELAKHPTQTIKQVMCEYQNKKEKTLKLIDKKYYAVINS